MEERLKKLEMKIESLEADLKTKADKDKLIEEINQDDSGIRFRGDHITITSGTLIERGAIK